MTRLKLMAVVSTAILSLVITQSATSQEAAQKTDTAAAKPPTVAIFTFEERGEGLKDMGKNVSALVFNELSNDSRIFTVERDEIDKAAAELGFTKSGQINQDNAIATGKGVGAKLIITGSIFKMAGKTNITAKIISTETTRVIGCAVNGTDTVDILSKKLSNSIADTLAQKASSIMPAPFTEADAVETLKKQLGGVKRPKVFVACSERHVGQATIDPAVETELKRILTETGFEVVNAEPDAEVVIIGKGFSETTLRKAGLLCAKARVELSAKTKEKSLLCADRQVSVGIDAAESLAGKQALQNAAVQLALRMIPKIVKK